MLKNPNVAAFYQEQSSRQVSDFSVEEARRFAIAVLASAGTQTKGDIAVLKRFQGQVDALVAAHADDPELLAIRANLSAMEAGVVEGVGDKLRLSKSASRELDRLVRDNPENGGVLMQRATNALYAPRVAGRIRIAVADLEALLTGEFALMGGARIYVQSLLAEAYVKSGKDDQAKLLLTEIAAADAPYWSEQAKQRLQKF